MRPPLAQKVLQNKMSGEHAEEEGDSEGRMQECGSSHSKWNILDVIILFYLLDALLDI